MNPEELGGISAAGGIFTLIMCLLMLCLPRRFALLPVVLTSCYMTVGQQVVLSGLHFTVLRLVVIAAYLRIFLRNEARDNNWTKLDQLVMLWAIAGIVFYTLWWQTPAALINRLGVATDRAGMYFVFRYLIKDLGDMKRVCAWFGFALLPLAACFVLERISGQNFFYTLGGVPKFAVIRNGIIRCQGPFRHPILAGTFGAIWVPFVVVLCLERKGGRLSGVFGLVGASFVTLLSGSSGPLVTYVSGIIALLLLPLRRSLRAVRWGIVAALVAIQISMKNPIWFIFAHFNILHGSTGWHRSHLLDQSFRHFFDWCWAGTDLNNVGQWGVWYSDVTNQYLLEGLTGGIVTMVLFIGLFVTAFSAIGLAIRTAPKSSRFFFWAIGATLFAHVVTFFSVSYVDQNSVNFALVLALATTAYTLSRNQPPVRRPSGNAMTENSRFATH